MKCDRNKLSSPTVNWQHTNAMVDRTSRISLVDGTQQDPVTVNVQQPRVAAAGGFLVTAMPLKNSFLRHWCSSYNPVPAIVVEDVTGASKFRNHSDAQDALAFEFVIEV